MRRRRWSVKCEEEVMGKREGEKEERE